MATVKIDSEKNPEKRIEELIEAIAQLEIPDLDKFKDRFDRFLNKKRPPGFVQKEKELIQKIKTGGPSEEFWKRYDLLAAKLQDEVMTGEENEEFLEMVKLTELWTYDRLKLIIELSKLWDVTPKDVLKRLEIKPRKSLYA